MQKVSLINCGHNLLLFKNLNETNKIKKQGTYIIASKQITSFIQLKLTFSLYST